MTKEDRSIRLQKFVDQVHKQLIVSCQAMRTEALFGSDIMAKMAMAAAEGGARAIRANTPPDVKAIREKVDLPLIGLYKEVLPDTPVIITPTLKHAIAIAEAGADIIAIDCTKRPHPEGDLADFIARIHEQTDCLVMADISTFEEGVEAQAAGADMVSTTLSGYTDYSTKLEGPDLDLIKRLAAVLTVPVIGEGRYHTPEEVKQALDNGATAVVVGGAITRPKEITARYVKLINS
ncbi:MAG: N-acetylmannosamine-6-phosphate 2-epimerase [Anaerolineaceae bacterium]|jgi:N-acylglucosamine-6-phosphate 2-epimerase|nr:N-acetylmannosamine-6-phosphate 2-epimerase [Anaerolineaceae bacterium]HNX46904.1 N-acetylmannosamine-6-phosphate 2-epimerase [Anaerolineaceae bacterium]HPT22915.1 N-acetylmannosamine-6-phosphate 2-epimerase [Anaerolineaceae bacterium]